MESAPTESAPAQGTAQDESSNTPGTHQLLNTMDAEHHKSLDLMAELEALLAASSQLSAGADSAPKGPAEFLAVEPMEHRANIVEVEEFEESEGEQDEQEAGLIPHAPAPSAPNAMLRRHSMTRAHPSTFAAPSIGSASQLRRSSVVNLGEGSLFKGVVQQAMQAHRASPSAGGGVMAKSITARRPTYHGGASKPMQSSQSMTCGSASSPGGIHTDTPSQCPHPPAGATPMHAMNGGSRRLAEVFTPDMPGMHSGMGRPSPSNGPSLTAASIRRRSSTCTEAEGMAHLHAAGGGAGAVRSVRGMAGHVAGSDNDLSPFSKISGGGSAAHQAVISSAPHISTHAAHVHPGGSSSNRCSTLSASALEGPGFSLLGAPAAHEYDSISHRSVSGQLAQLAVSSYDWSMGLASSDAACSPGNYQAANSPASSLHTLLSSHSRPVMSPAADMQYMGSMDGYEEGPSIVSDAGPAESASRFSRLMKKIFSKGSSGSAAAEVSCPGTATSVSGYSKSGAGPMPVLMGARRSHELTINSVEHSHSVSHGQLTGASFTSRPGVPVGRMRSRSITLGHAGTAGVGLINDSVAAERAGGALTGLRTPSMTAGHSKTAMAFNAASSRTATSQGRSSSGVLATGRPSARCMPSAVDEDASGLRTHHPPARRPLI